ncbi:MAG: bifunctional riboflavin kinase/FAD synthetase [Candidatus Sumerlaeaceae bacterium]|nr:bifunctional riboflavin kinase/FAD synthetase [Candidatus Sumerlaeaceae bacterium]
MILRGPQSVFSFYVMQILERPRWEIDGNSVVTVGVFDGLHRGHQALIARVVELATHKRFSAGLLTFTDHPLTLLAPPFAPKKLLYPDRKRQLLQQTGLDFVVCVEFSREFAQLTPEEFVSEILVSRAHIAAIVCGEDFCFGANGSGTVGTLKTLAQHYGFQVHVVDPVVHKNMFVRSTMIRDLLYTGDVTTAAELLTRPHELRGIVVRGYGRGRTLGFPTANLNVNPAYAIPARGVYVCAAYLPQQEFLLPALVNIGFNPTFESNHLSIEAHLVDFNEDIVGSDVYLFFLKRLRDERKFPNPDLLVAQLKRDRETGLACYHSSEMGPLLAAVRQLVYPPASAQ